MHRAYIVYNKIMNADTPQTQSSSSSSGIFKIPDGDFNTAAGADSATVAYLLAKRRTAGGYFWSYSDVKMAKAISERGVQLPFAKFLPGNTPLAPRSAFNMAGEDYVKRAILETFGVLCQVKQVCKSKKGNLMWLMTGVCPFHRHVHDSQHWAIEQRNEDTCVICFFKNPGTDYSPERCPIAYIPLLPLCVPGDGPNYPVATRIPPLDG